MAVLDLWMIELLRRRASPRWARWRGVPASQLCTCFGLSAGQWVLPRRPVSSWQSDPLRASSCSGCSVSPPSWWQGLRWSRWLAAGSLYPSDCLASPYPTAFIDGLREEMTNALDELNTALPTPDWLEISDRASGAITLLILRATNLLHSSGRNLTAATSLAILLFVAHNVAVVAGVLWSLVSPTVAFCYLTAWMLASLLASGLFRPARARQRGH